MEAFPNQFIESIEKYCVGKAIVHVEANGSYKDQQEHWVHLEDGTKLTFVTGTTGIDSDWLYGLTILDEHGAELVHERRNPSSGYDAQHPPFATVEPNGPPMRSGFSRACGQKITSAYFGIDAIGVCLDARNFLVSSTAGPLLYATWLYENTGDNQHQAVAKTITGEWRYGGSLGLDSSEQDKLC